MSVTRLPGQIPTEQYPPEESLQSHAAGEATPSQIRARSGDMAFGHTQFFGQNRLRHSGFFTVKRDPSANRNIICHKYHRIQYISHIYNLTIKLSLLFLRFIFISVYFKSPIK